MPFDGMALILLKGMPLALFSYVRVETVADTYYKSSPI